MTMFKLPTQSFFLGVVSATLAFTLAGCGDSSSETTAATTDEETTEAETTEADPTTGGSTDPAVSTSTGSSSTGAEPVCGDGVVDEGEACDGEELNGADCASEGFADGPISCNDECELDTSMCVTELMCSDAIGAAECTVGDEASCACVGCVNDGMCTLEDDCVCGECAMDGFCSDPANCNEDGQCDPYNEGCGCIDCSGHPQCFPVCGDGVAVSDNDEACDGEDLGGNTCVSEGFDGGGALGCDDACGLVTDECLSEEVCGDSFIGATEACDGDSFGAEDCATQGFAEGELSCTDSCEIDVSACVDVCGDEQVTGNEECDGELIGEETCISQGFPGGGDLKCNAESCLYNTADCFEEEVCGDGAIGETEVCDGKEFNGATCISEGFPGGGALNCVDECAAIDTDDCAMEEVCGDGKIGESEDCDGDNLNEETCESQGFSSGELACSDRCAFVTDACVE